jgi:hypothetical protein
MHTVLVVTILVLPSVALPKMPQVITSRRAYTSHTNFVCHSYDWANVTQHDSLYSKASSDIWQPPPSFRWTSTNKLTLDTPLRQLCTGRDPWQRRCVALFCRKHSSSLGMGQPGVVRSHTVCAPRLQTHSPVKPHVCAVRPFTRTAGLDQ